MLLWIHIFSHHFLVLRLHIILITFLPFCKQFRVNIVQFWFWKKCFTWERNSNRHRTHSCLSHCFPVFQQFNLFSFFPEDEKFQWSYNKTNIIWGIWDHRNEIWCSEVYTLLLTKLLLLHPSVSIKMPW